MTAQCERSALLRTAILSPSLPSQARPAYLCLPFVGALGSGKFSGTDIGLAAAIIRAKAFGLALAGAAAGSAADVLTLTLMWSVLNALPGARYCSIDMAGARLLEIVPHLPSGRRLSNWQQ
jgi:hypothetical protein